MFQPPEQYLEKGGQEDLYRHEMQKILNGVVDPSTDQEQDIHNGDDSVGDSQSAHEPDGIAIVLN
jgi:hypothetical protein